jgi:hypothetical protein
MILLRTLVTIKKMQKILVIPIQLCVHGIEEQACVSCSSSSIFATITLSFVDAKGDSIS